MKPIKPMLAVSGDPFTAAGWIFEPKIDGTRCIARLLDGSVILQNRRLIDITDRYPEIHSALASKGNYVLDGEIAVFSSGRPDFSSLAAREHQKQKIKVDYLSKVNPASYIVFDILYVEGRSVMEQPLSVRKEILKEELLEDDLISIIGTFPKDGVAYFKAALKMGLEGVVGKRASSIYQPGVRSPNWMKIKRSLTADLVVGGYIPGQGRRAGLFGGLLVGAYDAGRLVYVGRVGSGFSDMELEAITKEFKPISLTPFSNPPPTPGVIWLSPELVVEVTGMEVTHDGHLRAPVFVRMRDDKEPEDCLLGQLKQGTTHNS